MGEVLKTSERAYTVTAYLGWKHHGVNITNPPTTLPPLPAWNAAILTQNYRPVHVCVFGGGEAI